MSSRFCDQRTFSRRVLSKLVDPEADPDLLSRWAADPHATDISDTRTGISRATTLDEESWVDKSNASGFKGIKSITGSRITFLHEKEAIVRGTGREGLVADYLSASICYEGTPEVGQTYDIIRSTATIGTAKLLYHNKDDKPVWEVDIYNVQRGMGC